MHLHTSLPPIINPNKPRHDGPPFCCCSWSDLTFSGPTWLHDAPIRPVVSRSHFARANRQPLLLILTSALTPASTSQSLGRWRGGQEPVTIETSAAACSFAYLLLYELKQGASIHILAREVREAAKDKGIGRSKKGVVVVVVRMG